MAEVPGGYQPDTRSESSRRADFDLRRRISRTGGGTVGPPGPPGNPGVVQAVIAGANVTVDNTNPAYPIVSSTGGGGTGTDEVWIGNTAPTDPNIELWFDPDATSPEPGGGMGSYVHNQATPAATWVIVHNLNAFPNVTVEDSAGTTVEGEVVFDNANQLTLTFSGAFSGVAYLS